MGTVKATTEDADQLKAKLAEKGFEDAVVVTEKKVVPSSDALALTQQLRSGGKSEVRSLVKTTGGTRAIGPVTVDPNLREVLINGGSEQARYDVIGDTVNTAARIVKSAGAGEIWISEDTRLSLPDRMAGIQKDIIAKAKDQPITIHSIDHG